MYYIRAPWGTLCNGPTRALLEIFGDSGILRVRGRWIGQVENIEQDCANPPQGETENAQALELFYVLRKRLSPPSEEHENRGKFSGTLSEEE